MVRACLPPLTDEQAVALAGADPGGEDEGVVGALSKCRKVLGRAVTSKRSGAPLGFTCHTRDCRGWPYCEACCDNTASGHIEDGAKTNEII